MTWCKFYNRYAFWNIDSIKGCISALSDVGAGSEVVDVVSKLADGDSKNSLIRKAMHLGVKLSQEDFSYLEGQLPPALYARVAKYGKFRLEGRPFNPDNFAWDEFYTEFDSLADHILEKAIATIEDFGPNEEVTEVILRLPDELAEKLYKRARSQGYKFTYPQLDEFEKAKSFPLYEEKVKIINCSDDSEDIFSEIGRLAHEAADGINKLADALIAFNGSETLTDELNEMADGVDVDDEEEQDGVAVQEVPRYRSAKKTQEKKIGFWRALGMLFSSTSSSGGDTSSNSSGYHSSSTSAPKRHSGRCDGDCAHCPPHYGYRHGRWYYGHDHVEGCVFGGNKCSGGRD